MKVAIGQYAVFPVWEDNAKKIISLMQQSVENKADLLVLPEGVLARDIIDPDLVLKSAQPLDGPFMQMITEASRGNELTVIMTVHVPVNTGKTLNVAVAIRNGEIIARYNKLHLYDAFSVKESERVITGDKLSPIIDVAGMKVAMMTCYDVRFPELARALVLSGADVLVLPAAWVKGPLKEMHWEVMCVARALENTCYLVGVGECGPRNIGNSLVVDPLGVIQIQAGEQETLIYTELSQQRVDYTREILPVLQNRKFSIPELAKQ